MALPRKRTTSAAPVAQTTVAAVAQPPAGTGMGPNLMDTSIFVSGGGVPDGDYCIFAEYAIHTPTDKATGAPKGDPKLGVMVTYYAINDLAAEPRKQHYSVGRNAHKSFMPNADGSGIVPIPGAPPQPFYHDTAWEVFINEAVNAGVPDKLPGPKSLNGFWVHITQVNEPESWSKMPQTGATAEVQGKPREPVKIAVISQILPGGNPLQGGGGLEALQKGAKPVSTVVTAKDIKAIVGATAAATLPADGVNLEDLAAAVEEAATAALEKPENSKGMPRGKFRQEVGDFLDAQFGADVKDAAFTEVISNEAELNKILGKLGFVLQGLQVKLLGM